MTEGDKDLLIKDLCGRLRYGVKIYTWYGETVTSDLSTFQEAYEEIDIEQLAGIKPYLRPMSSMTEDEANELSGKIIHSNINSRGFVWVEDCSDYVDWLNAHHFDYRGFIPMGLALEAPEGLYE